MFMGIVVKANKRITFINSDFDLHITNATLDIESCTDDGNVQLIIRRAENDFILCNLNRKGMSHTFFDLTFRKGEKVVFLAKGNGDIHVVGTLEQPDYYDESISGDEEKDDLRGLLESNLLKGIKKSKREVKAAKTSNEKNDNDDDDDDDDEDEEDEEDDSDYEPGKLEISNNSILEEGMANGEDDSDDSDKLDSEESEEDDESDESDEKIQQPMPKQIKLDKSNKLKSNGFKVKKEKQNEQKSKNKEKIITGGVKIRDIHVGSGSEAKSGKKISVYYEGRLKQNNKVFDSLKSGKPFTFNLGGGEVIKGWDIGVTGMRVGGKRMIEIPPKMAYGQKGSPPTIPPNAPLVFEVELKGVN